MARYIPNTINSVLFTLYGLFGAGVGLLLVDGYISLGGFWWHPGTGGTIPPRGADVGIGMVFLAMGALGIISGYELWKSRTAGLKVGLPLLLVGIAFAAFFISVEPPYSGPNALALFLGLDVVMITLAGASWRRLRLSGGSPGIAQTSSAPNRSFTRLAVAIIIAAVVIAASILSYTSFESTVSLTTTATGTLTSTTTATTTSTMTITSTEILTSVSNVGDLIFKQITPCSNIGYFAPWSVTLSNGQSETALNANFSQPYSGSPNNPSIIAFLVPNGNYSYSVSPANRFTPGAGAVTVDNQEVLVTLYVFMASCGSSTTTTG